MRLIFFLTALFCLVQPAFGAVDIALRGRDTVRIEDVYQQQGIPFIAIEDAIGAVGLSGHWNSIQHTFRIQSKRGWAEISPGSGYMKIGDEYYPIKDKPRFIDGRLRVTDSFVLNQLSMLTGRSIYFNNLNPDIDSDSGEEATGVEKFFAFLLNKKATTSGPLIRAIAIDPGHGGLDSGVIAASGYKEKQLNLELAEKLSKKIKMQFGVPVHLSRNGDYELTMEQRLQSASQEDVDIWLLLHAQASFSPVMKGVTLFVRPEQERSNPGSPEEGNSSLSDSYQLAQQLATSLRDNNIPVMGIIPSSRLSLGRGNLPTVQIELGFLSHPDELVRLQDPVYQNVLVEALFTGIKRFAELNKEK